MSFSNLIKRHAHKELKFLRKDDLEIFDKILQGKKVTWNQVSTKLSRSRNEILYRWHNILKPYLVAKSFELNMDFEQVLKQEFKLNADTMKLANNTKWTPIMDQQLLNTVQKLGPVFSLMKSEFPQFSSGQLQARYNLICPYKLFSPQDISKLEAGMEKYKNNVVYQIHMNLLPKHSPLLISRKLKELKNGTLLKLTDFQIEQITSKVAKYGRLYFYLGDKQQFSFRQLLTLWAYYEPIDQMNAVWSKEIDDCLIEYSKSDKSTRPDLLLDYFSSELEARLYLLKTNPNLRLP